MLEPLEYQQHQHPRIVGGMLPSQHPTAFACPAVIRPHRCMHFMHDQLSSTTVESQQPLPPLLANNELTLLTVPILHAHDFDDSVIKNFSHICFMVRTQRQ